MSTLLCQQSAGANLASELAQLALAEAPSPSAGDGLHRAVRPCRLDDICCRVRERAIQERRLAAVSDDVVAGRYQGGAHDASTDRAVASSVRYVDRRSRRIGITPRFRGGRSTDEGRA
jgi:hypothetical protein